MSALRYWAIAIAGTFVFSVVSVYAETKVCFTPGQDCQALFVAAVGSAQHTLEVQEYHLTNRAIVAAVLRAQARGVKVQVLLDKTATKEATPFTLAGIPARIDYRVRIAHNKIMIVDDHTIIGGSFNPTASAQLRNAENLTITDDADIAKLYEINFYKRWTISREIH